MQHPLPHLLPLILLLLLLHALPSAAQFQFFDQIFNAGTQQHHHHHQHQHQPRESPNVPSDSSWYQQNHDNAHCTNYLCPGTLACVHFPHHCPCAFPAVEDKVELGEGVAVCVSKGGWRAGEAGRKIELARRGVL